MSINQGHPVSQKFLKKYADGLHKEYKNSAPSPFAEHLLIIMITSTIVSINGVDDSYNFEDLVDYVGYMVYGKKEYGRIKEALEDR